MHNYNLFFELLQIAVGTRNTLSRVPTKNEWGALFKFSQKQALVGVCFVGVQRLVQDNGAPWKKPSQMLEHDGEEQCEQCTQNLPKPLWLKWLSVSASIQSKNQELAECCVSLCKELAHDGLKSCVLKGQSNLPYYPKSLRKVRMPGDIDVWCMPADSKGLTFDIPNDDGVGTHKETFYGKDAVIAYALTRARNADIPTPLVCFHHVDLEGVWSECVEMHHRPSYLFSPLRNQKFERFIDSEVAAISNEDGDFPRPSVSFNAIYQLTHIYHHLFLEGIGLRQLVDYYFVLKTLNAKQQTLIDAPIRSKEEILRLLQDMGLRRLAAAVMYVLQKVFEPHTSSEDGDDVTDWQNLWPWMLCKPDPSAGQFLLDEVMRAGNFGHYDKTVVRGKHNAMNVWVNFKRNFRFIRFYPRDVLWEPIFRVYHHFWRKKYILQAQRICRK